MVKLKGKAKIKANKKQRNRAIYQNSVRKKNICSKIKKYNDPILKETCYPVNYNDEETFNIVKELKEVLLISDNGVGLAASQIGYDKRIIAVCLDRKNTQEISILLNPSIINQSEEKVKFKEGCLSYPNFYAIIERPKEIEVEYETIDGELKKEKFKDFSCIVLCHEIDHTKGICLVGDAYYKNKQDEIQRRRARRKLINK